MTALDDTQPIPRITNGALKQKWAQGDRVTDRFLVDGRVRRYVGTITEVTPTVWRVAWDHCDSVATYVHSHEPTSVRVPSEADERAAAVDAEKVAVAREIRRLAGKHPEWSTDVLFTLHKLASDLAVS